MNVEGTPTAHLSLDNLVWASALHAFGHDVDSLQPLGLIVGMVRSAIAYDNWKVGAAFDLSTEVGRIIEAHCEALVAKQILEEIGEGVFALTDFAVDELIYAVEQTAKLATPVAIRPPTPDFEAEHAPEADQPLYALY